MVTLCRFFIMCAVDGSIWEPLAVDVRDIMRGLCKRGQFIHPPAQFVDLCSERAKFNQ